MDMRNSLRKGIACACVALMLFSVPLALAPSGKAEPIETGSIVGAFAEPRTNAGVAMIGDRIYIIGGMATVPAPWFNDSVVIFNVTTGKTTYGQKMPVGVGLASCLKGSDGRIYIFGGINYTLGWMMTTQIYSPRTDSWSYGAIMPRSTGYSASAVGPDGRFYIFGGVDGGTPINSTLIYNPTTDAWTYGKPMPNTRMSAFALRHSSNIMVIGGLIGGATNTVDIYEPASDSWSSGLQLNFNKAASGAAVGRNGMLYSFGGADDWSTAPDPRLIHEEFERYDPRTGGPWLVSDDHSMIAPRAYFGTVMDDYGRVYMVGGHDGYGVSNIVEFFLPSDVTGTTEIAITSPADGAIVSGMVAVTVDIRNNPSPWSFPFMMVDLYVDGVLRESQLYALSWTFLWDTSGIPDSTTHVLMIRAHGWDASVNEDSIAVTVWSQSPEERIAEIQQRIVNLETEMNTLISALEADIAALQADIDAQSSDIQSLLAQVTALQAALNALLTTVSSNDAAVDAQLGALSDKLDALETSMNDTAETVDTKMSSTIGFVNLGLVVVVILLLAMMLVTSRKKP